MGAFFCQGIFCWVQDAYCAVRLKIYFSVSCTFHASVATFSPRIVEIHVHEAWCQSALQMLYGAHHSLRDMVTDHVAPFAARLVTDGGQRTSHILALFDELREVEPLLNALYPIHNAAFYPVSFVPAPQ